MRVSILSVAALCVGALQLACTDDAVATSDETSDGSGSETLSDDETGDTDDSADSNSTQTVGDGDGDTTGDGDGDTTGDGDGDPAGDGDGDGDTTGDGDTAGDTTGDGDGDTTGDGDGDTTGDGDGDGDPLECELEHFVHAPPPTIVDGLAAVPIDILALEAMFEFEPGAQDGAGVALMTFQVGPDAGRPIFDLRQAHEELLLDGEPIDDELLARHDFGRGFASGFAILDVELEACSLHELEVSYPIAVPDSPNAGGLSYPQDPARLRFDLFSSDLNPGRYLEAWMPANMPWDRYPVSFAIELIEPEEAHVLVTNGEAELLEPGLWQLEFGPETTAMAPMVLVYPASEVDFEAGDFLAANDQLIHYEVWANAGLNTPAANYVDPLLSYLEDFIASSGDYAYPSMIAYLYETSRSMEYAGATTSSPAALEHEVFHSWWARGLEPATYSDGWIDEAWTMFNTYEPVKLTPVPFNFASNPVQLYDPHPFGRDTPDASYSSGRRLFAGIADLLGTQVLRDLMADFYAAGPLPRSITTAELERHLYCASGDDDAATIRQAFHRFVYGLGANAAAPDPDYCG